MYDRILLALPVTPSFQSYNLKKRVYKMSLRAYTICVNGNTAHEKSYYFTTNISGSNKLVEFLTGK